MPYIVTPGAVQHLQQAATGPGIVQADTDRAVDERATCQQRRRSRRRQLVVHFLQTRKSYSPPGDAVRLHTWRRRAQQTPPGIDPSRFAVTGGLATLPLCAVVAGPAWSALQVPILTTRGFWRRVGQRKLTNTQMIYNYRDSGVE